MRPRVLALAAAFSLTTAIAAPGGAAGPPSPAEMRLSNGLTVVVREDHKLPIVSLRFAYRLDDAVSAQGLHILAPRLMLDSTKHVERGQYGTLLDAAGGRDQTWGVTMDEASFAVTVPSNRVDLPLWLWSDQMGFLTPRLDMPMIVRASALAIQDRRMRVEESACGIAEQEMRRALYAPSHPYHRAPRGVPDEVAQTDLETMKRFVARTYVPGSAVLIFVGDISASDALAHAQKWFGDIPSLPRAAPVIDQSLPSAEARIVAHAHVDSPRVRVSWRIPASNDVSASWTAFRHLLDGQEVGLLRWKLREQSHLASSVQVSYWRRAHGSLFSVEAVVAEGHEPDEVVAAIDAFFKDIAPGARQIKWARMEAARERVLAHEKASRRAEQLEDDWIAGGAAASDQERDDFSDATVIELVGRVLQAGHRAVFECVPDAAAPIAGVVVSRSLAAPEAR
jgi:predicted Zn-dependent peptidase